MTWGEIFIVMFGLFPATAFAVAWGTIKLLDYLVAHFRKDKSNGN